MKDVRNVLCYILSPDPDLTPEQRYFVFQTTPGVRLTGNWRNRPPAESLPKPMRPSTGELIHSNYNDATGKFDGLPAESSTAKKCDTMSRDQGSTALSAQPLKTRTRKIIGKPQHHKSQAGV
jgi:hypothetical protein